MYGESGFVVFIDAGAYQKSTARQAYFNSSLYPNHGHK